jgi:FKBP-type peptidyl-prolyl cis-trans isomerase SlyD
MIHRFRGIVLDQVALGHIGLAIPIMHEDAIPGFVFWRTTPCDHIVPGIAAHKDRIHVNDHPAIVKQAMIDTLTYGKTSLIHKKTPQPDNPQHICYDTAVDHKFSMLAGTRIIARQQPTPQTNAMKDTQRVGRNKVVTMQYSLTSTTGVVVREAGGAPVSYLHGTGNLFPKLEHELENHRVGDIVTARLLPDDAFGKRNSDLVQDVPLEAFPTGEKIEVGGKVVGTAEDGTEVTFAVTEIRNGIARLDGNHPLAGQSLVFEVEIQGIRDASDEEIRQGKALD